MADQTVIQEMIKGETNISIPYLIGFMLMLPSVSGRDVSASKTHLPYSKIIVAADGSGDYKTIQGAINSLPDSSASARTIFIKKGTYNEKLYIEKNNISFEGEDREKTIIIASIARDEWRCGHKDDWGVATMNIGANDITLKNLTVTNNFGFDYTERKIWCETDTPFAKEKVLRKDGHEMALRTMNMATRLKAVNCRFRSFGGDTVSPWEIYNGMWYFKDCIMEGGVDFYCPRGWAWAENCEFISHTGPAAIWHDGSGSKDSKTVLVNCSFKGYDGFLLGRYHREAQFYLINCLFAKNMKDTPIYRVATNNIINWGERIYYYNCHREGGNDFKWYKNNLPGDVSAKDINVKWVFGNRWNPEEK
ncbi:MAG TPA: pectinesterase family protein [Chitinophagaceae bacterium]|nr:pectinesterase family protein [Chitinophagaceae bacterium]